MSMREGMGSIGVSVGWANCLVLRDGFGDVGWVIAWVWILLILMWDGDKCGDWCCIVELLIMWRDGDVWQCCVGVWSCILLVVRGASIMCEGIGGLSCLWRGLLAEELFMSMCVGMGIMGVNFCWVNYLVLRDGFGAEGWVIAWLWILLILT